MSSQGFRSRAPHPGVESQRREICGQRVDVMDPAAATEYVLRESPVGQEQYECVCMCASAIRVACNYYEHICMGALWKPIPKYVSP